MKKRFVVVVCLVVLALAVPGLWATTLAKMSNADLTNKAQLIVMGQCLKLQSSWVGRDLVTLVTVSVSEVMKGSERSTVTVVLPGGADADRRVPIAVTYPGAPRIMPDETVFLFLSSESRVADGFAIVGFSQGKFSIVEDADGHKMVSRDLTGVSLQAGTGLSSGTATAVSLESFKQEIRNYLAGEKSEPELDD